MWITLFFYVPKLYIMGPQPKGVVSMDNLSFDITKMDSDRLRVEVYYKVGELVTELLGILYFEKAKKSFNTKPIGMDKWLCVDAKVEGLYTKDEAITPTKMIALCYDKIKMAGF